jgi:hypothetical protein
MLTKADDYPIHQTPEPIAYAGTDRNFYDRYFFNGFSADGELFFAAALGVYPHLNIMDAAFGVRIGGRQYNLRASRHLGMERLDTHVGPIHVEVIEPLQRLRIVIDDNEHGIAADIVFEGTMAALQEPRVTRRHGPRTIMDFTRLTQTGRYSGWLRAGGREIEVGTNVLGTRDRSWGVRAIGSRDAQALVPEQVAHFHWVWAPIRFEDRVLLFFVNEDEHGDAWHKAAIAVDDVGKVEHFEGAGIDIEFEPGSRWPKQGTIDFRSARDGSQYQVSLTAGPKFFMNGIGYLDPEWAHGIDKGPLAIGYDEIDCAAITEFKPPHLYVETIAEAVMTLPDGRKIEGIGTFEVLSMGPNAKRGFTGFCDGA